MANNSNGNYTFFPEFAENVILYRGADKVILGDGTGGHKDGWLYTQFVDGVETELGPVSAYSLAVEGGYEGTLAQWVSEIASASNNAQSAQTSQTNAALAEQGAISAKDNAVQASNTAAMWATGGTEGQPSSTNNALHYATVANESAVNAKNAEDRAAAWATGNTTGNPSATNNAKHYAEEAGDSANEAHLWANGGTSGHPDSANNAKYYSDQAHVWATGALNDNTSGGAQNSAKYFATQSEMWATGGMAGTPGVNHNAKYYADQAQLMHDQTVEYFEPMSQYSQQITEDVTTSQNLVDEAEMWATGGSNGTPSETNNAKYYAQIANQQAQKWAVGPGENTEDETYENNAKYYANMAKTHSDDIKDVTATTLYYLGANSGVTPPPDGEGWTPSLNNISAGDFGKYIWTKTTFLWGNNATSYVYNVGYLGSNGSGAVDSVNNLSGNIVLDGGNIFFDAGATTEEKKTLQEYINNLEEDLQSYADAAGSVKNVNGIQPVEGTVSIDASDIVMDKEEQESQTLLQYINSKEPVYATDAEIEALFAEEVPA